MKIKSYWQVMTWVVAVFIASPLAADSITFTLIPSTGNVSGPTGSTVGWGYSIANNSAADWYLATNLNANSFSNATPNLLFDFPEVAPGATATELFDPVNLIGLYELAWDPAAPNGFVNTGDFTLSGQWYDGDPFDGGTYIADATDVLVTYTATNTSSTSTPELSSLALVAYGFTLISIIRPSRRVSAGRHREGDKVGARAAGPS